MPAKVNIQAIVTFLLISFTLAWLLTLLLANRLLRSGMSPTFANCAR